MPNSPPFSLTDADRNLIARCHKARKSISGLAQLGGAMFWFHLILGIVFTIAVVILYVVKGAAAAPAATYLLPYWTWVFICFVAARSLRFEREAVELICKLGDDKEE